MRGSYFFLLHGYWDWPWDLLLTYENMREDSGPSLNPNVKKKDMFLLTPFVFLPSPYKNMLLIQEGMRATFNRSWMQPTE